MTPADEITALRTALRAAVEALEQSKLAHVNCGMLRIATGEVDHCQCGADDHNDRIKAAIAQAWPLIEGGE